MIKKLDIVDFPDKDLAHEYKSDCKGIETYFEPKASPDNFTILMDKVNELIGEVNYLKDRIEDLEGQSVRNGWDED